MNRMRIPGARARLADEPPIDAFIIGVNAKYLAQMCEMLDKRGKGSLRIRFQNDTGAAFMLDAGDDAFGAMMPMRIYDAEVEYAVNQAKEAADA